MAIEPLFEIQLDSLLVRQAGEDGLDSDAEWRLNVAFGVADPTNVTDPTNVRATYRLSDNSVHSGDTYGGTGTPLATLSIPASTYIDRMGDFAFKNFFVTASGREVDSFGFDDTLPRINEQHNFSLSDQSFEPFGSGNGFVYILSFTIKAAVPALILGTAGNDVLIAPETGPAFLSGQQGDDVIFGSPEDDFIAGGRGNDFLLGGEGRDTYIFGRESGRDLVFGFADGEDVIDLSPLNRPITFATFDQVRAHATQVGPLTVIDLGFLGFGASTITLFGTDVEALDPSDFILK